MAIITSILTGGVNNHQTTAEEANRIATDFVSEGVVGTVTNTAGVSPASGDFAVNAQVSPNMTVAVSAGAAYVTGTPTSQGSQTFRVKNSATANVTIAANSSGSTKYDWLYIKLDPTILAAPNTAGDDAATLVTSRSSVSGSDDGTPPTYGYPLAVITVANGATSITNGNIADKRTATGIQQNIADGSVTAAKLDFSSGIWGQEIGRRNLTSAGDTLSLTSLTAYSFLKVKFFAINSGTISCGIRFNNDSSLNYGWRKSISGASDTSSAPSSIIPADAGGNAYPVYGELKIINFASQEKTISGFVTVTGASGASTAPIRIELAGKWANTTDPITRVDIVNSDSGDYAIGSVLIVEGHN